MAGRQVFQPAEDMHSFVGVAFLGKHTARGAEQLFENRHLEYTPEQVTITGSHRPPSRAAPDVYGPRRTRRRARKRQLAKGFDRSREGMRVDSCYPADTSIEGRALNGC